MSECGCKHNQTHDNVFQFLKASKRYDTAFTRDSEIRGFGLFVIPAPDLGILETRTLVVPDINYTECTKRAANCKAFQWIPSGMQVKEGGKDFVLSSSDDLRAYLEVLACDDCKGGCKMGCNCSYSGQVNCAKNYVFAY